MIRPLIVSFLFLLAAGTVTSQSQLENAGFEAWDIIAASPTDTIFEPVDWSSLKTSDNPSLSTLAPVVSRRSSDAHSGNFSVELINVSSFVVANGVVTNGRLHPDFNTPLSYIYTDTLDDQWNTSVTGRPDSIAGWFSYAPLSNDTMQVKVILHRGFGKQPDEDYMDTWTGAAEFRSAQNTGGKWVRFSAPFTYYNDEDPEYILVILNSGNGYQPVAGSMARFDDLELVYNPTWSDDRPGLQSSGSVFVVENRHLVIRGVDFKGFQHARILDITGRLVWAGAVTSDHLDISSAGLERGIYLVTISGTAGVFSQKIMVM